MHFTFIFHSEVNQNKTNKCKRNHRECKPSIYSPSAEPEEYLIMQSWWLSIYQHFFQDWLKALAMCVSVCALITRGHASRSYIYTTPALSLPASLSLSLPPSLPPSLLPPFICSRDRALVWSFLFLYFPVLCSFPAVQNELGYGKYTVHAAWKSPIRPAVCSCYKLSRLYLVLDRPPCHYNYHQHQKGYLGKLYLAARPPHFPLSALSL